MGQLLGLGEGDPAGHDGAHGFRAGGQGVGGWVRSQFLVQIPPAGATFDLQPICQRPRAVELLDFFLSHMATGVAHFPFQHHGVEEQVELATQSAPDVLGDFHRAHGHAGFNIGGAEHEQQRMLAVVLGLLQPLIGFVECQQVVPELLAGGEGAHRRGPCVSRGAAGVA